MNKLPNLLALLLPISDCKSSPFYYHIGCPPPAGPSIMLLKQDRSRVYPGCKSLEEDVAQGSYYSLVMQSFKLHRQGLFCLRPVWWQAMIALLECCISIVHKISVVRHCTFFIPQHRLRVLVKAVVRNEELIPTLRVSQLAPSHCSSSSNIHFQSHELHLQPV